MSRLRIRWIPTILTASSLASVLPACTTAEKLKGEVLVAAVAASASDLELALPGKWKLAKVACSSGAPWSGAPNVSDLQVDLQFDGKKLVWASTNKDEKASRVESPYAVQSHLLTFQTKKSYVTYFAELTGENQLQMISPTVWGLGGECPSKDTLLFTFNKVSGI